MPAYLIRGLCPRTDISMGAHGFCIDLSPDWKDAVAASGLDASKIRGQVDSCGRAWLDSCGYDSIYDPDNYGAWSDKKLPPGPNARPLYETNQIRVSWGEWGAEHISIPGNACGLDIDRRAFGAFLGGPSLTPHNVDCWAQKNLLLIVFCEIAENIILFSENAAVSIPAVAGDSQATPLQT